MPSPRPDDANPSGAVNDPETSPPYDPAVWVPTATKPSQHDLSGASQPPPVWAAESRSWPRWAAMVAEGGPVRWREVLALLLLVAVSDLTVYRGHGFSGYAALFLIAPWLLLAGCPRPRFGASLPIVGVMVVPLAARMLWLGSGLAVVVGLTLMIAWAMAIAGRRLCMLDVEAYALQTVVAGYPGIAHYLKSGSELRLGSVRVPWLSAMLPLAALGVFGTLFVLANPDLASSFGDILQRATRWLHDWAGHLSLSWAEMFFWIAVAWVVIGLWRPIVRGSVLDRLSSPSLLDSEKAPKAAESPLYPALRNTLLALIVLFVVYLAFEFKTLWFREFPKGFYYAGYAHEGAAWLTASLALATVVLSLIFRGNVLGDPRLPQLRRLAWVWSVENLVLAATVYNRLWIYVAFNGMTWMRMVAIFGVSTVVAGVVLVIAKIAQGHDFAWLVRRHLIALALAVYLFVLTPIDAIVYTYNVHRIVAGDLAPSVQISVHPIDSEGILVLQPLTQSDNEIIREGVRAILAERAIGLERASQQPDWQHWTAFQLADRVLAAKLEAIRADWEPYADASKRTAAVSRFDAYVYQWY